MEVAEAVAVYDAEYQATTSAEAFLHAHGIAVAPERFGVLVTDAVRSFEQCLYPGDPASDFLPEERAALVAGGFDLMPDLGERDPLAESAAAYSALLETSLTAAQAARWLGVDPSRIRQRLTARPPTLYGVRAGGGAWRLPRFQFDGERTVPGLGAVVSHLDPELHPLAVYRWFTTPSPDLVTKDADRTLSPRNWLRLGQAPAVVAALAAEL